MRARVLIVLLCAAFPAFAQSLSPAKVVTVRTAAELALPCTGTVRAVRADTGQEYYCNAGAWVLSDVAAGPSMYARSAAPAGAYGSRPCWDITGADLKPDGTCDLFFDPVYGVVNAKGQPHFSGRVAIFSITADQHETFAAGDADGTAEASDGAVVNMGLLSKAQAIPQGYAIQASAYCAGFAVGACPATCVPMDTTNDGTNDTCGLGWSAESYTHAKAAGASLGTHGVSHCYVGPDWLGLSWKLGARSTSGLYTDANGTVQVTEGSATVTGTNTDFVALISAARTYADCVGQTGGGNIVNFNPRGALFAVDVNNNTVGGGAWERHVLSVNSLTQITLDSAFPSDMDNDGTTGETFTLTNAHSDVSGDGVLSSAEDDGDGDGISNMRDSSYATAWFAIHASPDQADVEYRDSISRIETGVGTTGYKVRWGAGPGNQEPNPALEGIWATYGLEAFNNDKSEQSYSFGDAPGSPRGVGSIRWMVNYATDWDTGLKLAVDEAVAAKWQIWFSGHSYKTSGSSTDDDYWSQATYTSFLAYCAQLMREGKAVCADPGTATELSRVWQPANQYGVNLLANPHMKYFAGMGMNGTTNPGKRWPWHEYGSDADWDIDSTTEMEQYDDANFRTKWKVPAGKPNTSGDKLYQSARLSTGYYQYYAWVESNGYPRTGANGVRACIQPTISTGAPAGETKFLPVLWYIWPYIDYTLDGMLSTFTAGNTCSGWVHGTGISRGILGWFYVPPELDGVGFEIGVQRLGGDIPGDGTDNDSDGSTDEVDYTYIRNISLTKIPGSMANSTFAGVAAVPRTRVSMFPQYGVIDYTKKAAFMNIWSPQESTTPTGRNDTPQTDLERWDVAYATGSDTTAAAIISGLGRFESQKGLLVGDTTNDATAQCISRNATLDALYEDSDCDDTLDNGERFLRDQACADTASATTVAAENCSAVVITGSTTITTINTCDAANKGRSLTIIWGASATFDVTDGSNLKLNASITTYADDDSLSLVCNGTNWVETGRADN